jgi:hypothetical protein
MKLRQALGYSEESLGDEIGDELVLPDRILVPMACNIMSAYRLADVIFLHEGHFLSPSVRSRHRVPPASFPVNVVVYILKKEY